MEKVERQPMLKEKPELLDLSENIGEFQEDIEKKVEEVRENGEERMERVVKSLDIPEEVVEEEKDKMIFGKRGDSILRKIGGLVAVTKKKVQDFFQGREIVEDIEPAYELLGEVKNYIGAEQYEELKKSIKKKNEAIKKTREKYQDDNELFEVVIGVAPKGEIKVIQGPFSLYFKCMDSADFAEAYIASQKAEGKTVDDKTKQTIADNVSGMRFSNFSTIDDLRGLLILENVRETLPEKSEAKKQHEEQHIFFKLYKDSTEDEILRKSAEEDMKKAKSDEEKEEALIPYLEYEREEILEWSAKNEILAYYREGEDMTNVFLALTRRKEKGGAYDFFAKHREKIQNDLENFGIDRKRGREAMEKIFIEEYEEILRNAVYAIDDLEKMGKSKNEIIGILITELLENWPEVIRGSRAEKSEI